jgi:hypothetical protein
MNIIKSTLPLLPALILFLSFSASAQEEYVLTLKNNQFSPKELTIPMHQKVKLIVKNRDAAAAEFESTDLNREKVVTPNSEITVYIGPLDAGTYTFFDDFHRETTGAIIVK